MATRALLYRRPAEPATLLVKHGSQVFAIRLRRHRRARRYTLRIHPTDREAILTMPPRGTLVEAKDFAQLHGGWIAARLGRLPKAAPFQAGTVIPLRGVPHRIVPRSTYFKRIVQAHKLHHAVESRDGAVSFGFIYAPPVERLKRELAESRGAKVRAPKGRGADASTDRCAEPAEPA